MPQNEAVAGRRAISAAAYGCFGRSTGTVRNLLMLVSPAHLQVLLSPIEPTVFQHAGVSLAKDLRNRYAQPVGDLRKKLMCKTLFATNIHMSLWGLGSLRWLGASSLLHFSHSQEVSSVGILAIINYSQLFSAALNCSPPTHESHAVTN